MPDDPNAPDPSAPPPPADPPADPPDPKLGAEGEKALEAFKTRAREAEKEAKAAKTELEQLRIASLTGQDKAIAEAKAAGRAEALKDGNERLLRAEVKALAAEMKFADPADAAHFVDLAKYDPDGDSSKQMKADLAALLKDKPYLAAGPGSGSGEGGPRGGTQTKEPDVDAWIRAATGRS